MKNGDFRVTLLCATAEELPRPIDHYGGLLIRLTGKLLDEHSRPLTCQNPARPLLHRSTPECVEHLVGIF